MIKRLFVDIETSPNVAYIWRPGHKLSIDYSNIVEERQIITVCWKWQGDNYVSSIDWGSKQDDAKIVKKVIPLLEEADEVVAHNGGKFDIPWIRGRALFHRIPMSPKVQIVDTLTLARRYFNLNSNRLDYIGKYLGLEGKIGTDYSLWKRVMAGENAALREMVTYCKRDVELLEEMWDIVSPYFPPRTHSTGNRGECPECGSGNLTVNKRRVTSAGHKQVQLVCGDCGKYHTMPAKKWDKVR